MKSMRNLIPVLTTLLMAMPLTAQSLNVTINGSSVRFMGTQPMVMQGRVLVPLRGVLEQMGAFVGWDAVSRTVFAQKSGIDAQLPIGSRTAIVNGRTVSLDVPAQIIGGSTLVPLRFLGETLGAEVIWDNATRTVTIATGGNSTSPTPVASSGVAEDITSFNHNATDWLKAGSVLKVTMDATPGGTATFEIPGVVDKVVMKEVSTGRYDCSWTVPAGKNLAVTGGKVIGQLRVGNTQRLIQAGNTISIDTIPPRVINGTPDPDSTVADVRPNISVVSEDSGSGVDPVRVKMLVNGANVADQATITRNFATYQPQQPLKTGQNSVKVTVVDHAGNSTTQTWSFNVQGAGSIVSSFTHSDISNLQPGDVITTTMKGKPNGIVNFVITSMAGKVIGTKAMQETSSGVYEGEYTVKKNQDLNGATIAATHKVATGQIYTVQSDASINAPSAVYTNAPVITSPVENKTVASPIVITGKAWPNSSVHLTVEYSTKVLGVFDTNGALSDQLAEVNAQGTFKSTPINLTTLIKGSNTRYTITATTVSPTGEESEPVTIIVKGN